MGPLVEALALVVGHRVGIHRRGELRRPRDHQDREAKHLREVEGFPVQYVSLHNEGEDWMRWPLDGSTASTPNHDYNMYWPPEQVAEFVRMLRPMLDAQGMRDVGVAPGEERLAGRGAWSFVTGRCA